jgi:hypothetical protein
MTSIIAGAGLASPAGLTTQDHAFFPALYVPSLGAAVFYQSDDTPLDVRYARWLGTGAPPAERVARLAHTALAEALGAFAALHPGVRVPLLLITSAPRPGWSQGDIDTVVAHLEDQGTVSVAGRYQGAAQAFTALTSVPQLLGEHEAVAMVAADSFVSLPFLEELVARPPCEWALQPRPPSEGAGALLFVRRPDEALGGPRGQVDAAAVVAGPSRDDNDEIVDGRAMTAALRQLPLGPVVPLVCGQFEVDALRTQEWRLAIVREKARFEPGCAYARLEALVGRVGAAAGVMSIAYGLALVRHKVLLREKARPLPYLAWAISPDGLRGVAACRAEA